MSNQSARCILYQLHIRCPSQGKCGSGSMRPILFALDGSSLGEAAPNAKEESIHQTRLTLDEMLAQFSREDCTHPHVLARQLHEAFPMNPAARAAMEMVFYDKAALKTGLPLYEYLKIKAPDGIPSAWPLPLGPENDMDQTLAEAKDASVLLVKCSENVEQDLHWLRWLSRQTDKAFRINANGQWTRDEAGLMIRELANMRVDYIEQPLPPHRLEDTARLTQWSPLPILLNDVRSSTDLSHIADHCNGFTIGLMKTGGYTESLNIIRKGHQLGMLIALDTLFSSSAGITAAAHLAGAVDFVNLVGSIPIVNDPIDGVRLKGGKIIMPRRKGLGIRVKQDFLDFFPRQGFRPRR